MHIWEETSLTIKEMKSATMEELGPEQTDKDLMAGREQQLLHSCHLAMPLCISEQAAHLYTLQDI